MKDEDRRMNRITSVLTSAFCLRFDRLVRESNPCQRLDRAPCYSVTPTRPFHYFRSLQGERGNRTLATTFTVSDAATTPNSPSFVRSGRGGARTLTAG